MPQPDESGPGTRITGAAGGSRATLDRRGESDCSSQARHEHAGAPLLAEIEEIETGRRLRDAGVRTAELNTWHPWKVAAYAELERWQRHSIEGTSDDLLAVVGEPPLSSRNAIGAIMQGAAKRGLIVNTDRYVTSRRPSAHARRIAVFRGTPERGGR